MAKAAKMPDAGDRAPAFEGITQEGNPLSLAGYRGRKVALFFYPEDDTPVCTRQACNLRDGYHRLLDAGIAVIGVSPDTTDKHDAFTAKYDLPFPLVADPDKKILNAYGVWGEKNMYGKTVVGVKRTTFLIDEKGVVAHVFKRPKVDNHATEIIEKFS
ncbi:MAG: thioredoxin-dependent thiol peroxidase [Rhodothermales bacterium]